MRGVSQRWPQQLGQSPPPFCREGGRVGGRLIAGSPLTSARGGGRQAHCRRCGSKLVAIASVKLARRCDRRSASVGVARLTAIAAAALHGSIVTITAAPRHAWCTSSRLLSPFCRAPSSFQSPPRFCGGGQAHRCRRSTSARVPSSLRLSPRFCRGGPPGRDCGLASAGAGELTAIAGWPQQLGAAGRR